MSAVIDLFKKFIADLKLRGYAERSITSYVRAVRQLQNFCCLALEDILEENLREYWLYCKEDSRPRMNQLMRQSALSGLSASQGC